MPDRDERHFRDEAERYWARWSGTARGRCPATWAAALAADPMLPDARVVIDLSLAGGGRRVLLGPASWTATAGRDGDARRVAGEMMEEPALSESLQPGEPGPSGRSVSVSVAGRLIAPGDILAAGWPLAGRAEVSLLAPGVSWDDRLVWIRGRLGGGVRFGTDDEVVDVSVEDPPLGQGEIPPWAIDTDRWPNVPDASVGMHVPIVIGRGFGPAVRVDSSDTGTNDDFVACYGWGLTVDDVWVSGAPAVLTTDYTVHELTDGLGLPVTVIRLVPAAGADEFAEVHVFVSEPDSRLDGLDVPAAIRRLLHEHGDMGTDRLSDRLFAECQARMSAYAPSQGGERTAPRLMINEHTGAIAAAAAVAASYPYLSLVWDGPGLGPVAVDHRAEPVADLAAGRYPLLQRPGGARYEEVSLDDLRTGFTIRHRYSPVQNRYNGIAIRTPANNALCEMALTILGIAQSDQERTSIHIADSASANAVADWLCEHFCRPTYDVEIDAYPLAWFLLRLGDAVRWTDPDVGFSQVAAIVVGRAWSRGLVTIRLRCYPLQGKIGGGSLSYLG